MTAAPPVQRLRVVLVCAPDGDIAARAAELAEVLRHRYLHGFAVVDVVHALGAARDETAAALAAAFDVPDRDETAFASPESLQSEATLTALESAQETAWQAIESWRATLGPDEAVIIVGDETLIRLLVCHALAIPLAERARFRIDSASVSVIDFRQRTMVSRINDVCHL